MEVSEAFFLCFNGNDYKRQGEARMDDLLDFLRTNAALVVSALALFLTINSARATRKHNRLTVQPRLSTFTKTNEYPAGGSTVHEITLSNSGLGPAVIKKYEVLLDGNPIEAEQPNDIFVVLAQALAAPFVPSLCSFGLLRKDYVMAKDEVLKAATITILNATPAQLEELKRVHLRVTYESAYGDSFTYDTKTHTEQGTKGAGWLNEVLKKVMH